MVVREITYEETKPFIMGKHYAKRMPSISYAYGLFDEEDLVGVLTIGKPASPFFVYWFIRQRIFKYCL